MPVPAIRGYYMPAGTPVYPRVLKIKHTGSAGLQEDKAADDSWVASPCGRAEPSAEVAPLRARVAAIALLFATVPQIPSSPPPHREGEKEGTPAAVGLHHAGTTSPLHRPPLPQIRPTVTSSDPSSNTAASTKTLCRKPRTQTKWPNDVVKVEGIDGEGFPTNDNGLKWWRLICGLIARQRVGINVNFEDVDEPARQGLFETMKEYLEFPKGTSEAQMNRVRGGHGNKEPFEVHKHLDHQDWEMFVETTTSKQFLEKSEHFKDLRGRITDNNHLSPKGYARKKKGKSCKEDTAMEEAGSENPWRQFPGRLTPYLRARAAPTPSTGEITWSSGGTKRLADQVIELKDHESGVREHDILSTAIDTPEHRGRVCGVSSSKGWKEAFGKENEGLWKKKKRSPVDPD
ncbi:hypothetical protein C2845_PM11G04500 [Panicum miliaceum]|uniref:Uncharacterized protein n=1 Tax=Panicum miliaceum TaxID=4540 RepID=A0A3L6RUT0_PANMI|nr:hypothetical protein C2845_PM11G04500 [Panicum miliaceum]